jgi:hypothetical protein
MTDTVTPINKNKEFIQPVVTDIRTCWEEVRAGIQSILDTSPSLTYMPEDVYSECVNGRSMLFTSPLGFVVLSVDTDPFTHDKTLVVWLGYVYETGQNNWLNHIEWFEQIATECGCRFLEARSDVKELESYFTSTGWELETRIYNREIKRGK